MTEVNAPPSTLVEFLTARLDEDEAHLRKVFSQQDRPHWPGCQYPGDVPGWCDCDLTERLHADIAAKRMILAIEMNRVGTRKAFIDVETADKIRGRVEGPVLQVLASVYTGHPDYREEWR